MTPAILPSPKPALSKAQRGFSRVVWGRWLIMFIVREGLGVCKWTPWKTLSETAWDVEEKHSGAKRQLLAFLLGLAVHIRYRTELRPSLVWAFKHVDEFDTWLEQHGGD